MYNTVQTTMYMYCFVYFTLHKRADNNIFGKIWKISNHFWKICGFSKNCPKATQAFPNINFFLKFLKIIEDKRRLPKTSGKIQRCFNRTSTNLSNIAGQA